MVSLEAHLISYAGFLLLWCFILFPWMTTLMFSAERICMKGRRRQIVPAALLLIIIYGAVLYIHYEITWFFFFPRELIRRIPMQLISLILVLITCYMFFLQCRVRRIRRGSITPLAIKEAVDTLPIGLAFYEDSGLVRLSNTKINSIAAKLLGHSLRNGNEFWDSVVKEEGYDTHVTDTLPDGTVLVNLKDGMIFALRREEVILNGHRIWTLTADDITQEYTLNVELEQKRAMVSEMNDRLKELGSRIGVMTMEMEILESKIRVHDRWAECLIRAKQYLDGKGSVTGEEVLSAFKNNISQQELSKEEESLKSRYEEILESARVMGIEIKISGKLPEDERLTPVIQQAMTTCLSNIACHTDGSTLYMEVQESPESIRICLSDDGTAPVGEIRESGGLSNLRRSIERLGGSMEVDNIPRFELRMELGGAQDVL